MPAPPRRRWLRYSLRTFLVLITALAIWLGVITKRARDQRDAVAALTELDCWIVYDYQPKAHQSIKQMYVTSDDDFEATPSVSPWLLRTFGDDYFVTVVGVCRHGYAEDVFPHLKKLPHLRTLDVVVRNTQELNAVGALSGLTRLGLYVQENIADESFATLSKLTELRELVFGGRDVANNCLEHLRPLAKLEQLDVMYLSKEDAGGMQHLTDLRDLRRLAIPSTWISDDSLVQLRQLPNLRELVLAGPSDNAEFKVKVVRCRESLPKAQVFPIEHFTF